MPLLDKHAPGDDDLPGLAAVPTPNNLPAPKIPLRDHKNDPPDPADTTPPPDTTKKDAPDDFTRMADLLSRLVGQPITIPSSGNPTIVPQQTNGQAMSPVIIIIVIVVGIGAYMWYKHKHKRGNDAAA